MAEQNAVAGSIKSFEGQFDDEDVVFIFRRHPLIIRKGLIISMSSWLIGPLAILVLTYVRPNDPPSMVAFFLALIASIIFGSLLILPWWISWYFSVFIVTTQRFVQISQKGLFHTSFSDMSLKQIQQVNYEIAGLQQTLLGFGTIKMQTYIGELVIHDVPHPAKIQRKLVQVLREHGIKSVEVPFKRLAGTEPADEEV
jgi:uncharacterized integral membrane protein